MRPAALRPPGQWPRRWWLAGAWLLVAQLLLAPPGLAVCWTLPGGLHLHIGWTDAHGQPTLNPQVLLHGAAEPPTDPAHAGAPTAAQVSTALVGSPLAAPAAAAWLLPLVTLAWAWQPARLTGRRLTPTPPHQPPRPARAA